MKRKMFLDKQKQANNRQLVVNQAQQEVNNLEQAQKETEQLEQKYITEEEVKKLCAGLPKEQHSIVIAYAHYLNLGIAKEGQNK